MYKLPMLIIIIMGVSGSGKTTIGQQLAADLDWPYFDGDDFHSLKNRTKMCNGIPLNDDDRSIWLSQISQHIIKQIKNEGNAVFSCSALKQQYQKQLQTDPDIIKLVYLKGPPALIKKRLESRIGHFMKSELLASQLDSLEEPENAMIVDIIHSPELISKTIQEQFCLL